MASTRSSDSRTATPDDEPKEKLEEAPLADNGDEAPADSSKQERDIERNPLSRIRSHYSSKSSRPRDEAFIVHFEDNDPANPRNFSKVRKASITLLLGFMALTGSIGSSIIAPAEPVIARYIGVSQEVTVLAISLFVLGFAVGPSMWAPISEVYGRKWSMLPAMFILGLFSIGTAVSKSAASVFITRFFGQCAACALRLLWLTVCRWCLRFSSDLQCVTSARRYVRAQSKRRCRHILCCYGSRRQIVLVTLARATHADSF